jgi:hypothetical protein
MSMLELLPTVSCDCPRYTLGESNLPLLKVLNVVTGTITVLTFILLAEVAGRAEATEQPAAPATGSCRSLP